VTVAAVLAELLFLLLSAALGNLEMERVSLLHSGSSREKFGVFVNPMHIELITWASTFAITIPYWYALSARTSIVLTCSGS
jgi:hypothetical protein